MDMDNAQAIVREQIEHHRRVAEGMKGLDAPCIASIHEMIAEALEEILKAVSK